MAKPQTTMHAGRADDGSGDNGLETRTDEADLQCGVNNGHAKKGVTGTRSTAHVSRSRNDFDWVNPDSADDGFLRRYRFPTLGADHADFVRARADPLACNLDNDMVLLWNEVEIEARGGAGIGKPPSEESIEDAYQRLYSAAVRHREDLQATLRDAGLERVNDLFTDSDSACGGFDDGREDVEGDDVCGDNGDDNAHDADDDVFDDSGVRGSWEFLSDDGAEGADGAGLEDDPLTQEIDLLRNSYDGACAVGYPEVSIPGDQLDGDKGTYGVKQEQLVEGQPGVKHIRQQHDREVVQTSSSGDSVSINSYNSSSKDSNNNNKSIRNNNDFKNVSSSSYITTNNINGGDSTRGVPEHGSSDCPAALTSGLLSHSSSRFDSGHYDTTSCSSEDDHPFSETGHAAVDTPRPGLHSSQAVSSPGRNIPVGDLGDIVGMDLGDSGPDRLFGHNSRSLGSADAEVFEDNGDLLFRRSTLGEENPHNRYPKEDRVYPDVFPKNSDTEKLQGNPPNDHDILMPHLIQPQPYPTPVHSPPANMEQFRPETNESSSSKFLSSSPIPARSRKFYANSSYSPQSSSVLNHPVESQPQLTTGDPDWGGMSILPLVASPHHHDLPVIDAPGSYSPTLVRCHAPDCGKTAALDIARHLYKNCHNCRGSYYCSRKCRHRDWKRHKHDVCHGSRVSSACKRVIEFCGLDPDVKSALSRLARRGFLSYGRGCVMLGFPDLRATEEFLCDGLKSLPKGDANSLQLLPVYVSLSELRGSKMYGGAEILQRLMTLCETYNPELKFLLNVGIGVRWNREQMLRTQTAEWNDQVGSFQYKLTVNGRTVLSESSDMPSFAGSSPNGGCMQSPKESSFSFHSTTIDSGYGDHQRSTPSKHPRSRDTSSRGRSVSVNSEDVGYGSLGDIRDSLAYSPVSPGQSFTDGAVFHSVQPPPSPPHPSPLSPPMNGENVVYYWDAEPRLKCPILQKCACLRLFNPAFDPPSSLPSYPHLANVPQDRKVSLPTRSVKNLSCLNPMVWPRRCGPTLILTDVPGSWYEAQDEFRLRELGPRTSVTAIRNDVTTKRAVQGKARELCFSNIQRRLRQRGVSLRRQFPEVYDELVEYVSGDTEHFPSRIIFPVDEHGSGRMFTCVLMPEAEPDLRWTQTAKLLDNLDISRERVWGPLVSGRLVRPSQAVSGPHPTGSAENTEFSSQANLPQPVGDGILGPDAKDCVDEGYSGDHVCVTKREGGSDSHNIDKNQCNIEVQQRNNLGTPSNTQIITRVCPRCLTRTTLVDGSTQTGVPINTTKVKATVPDLITQCPTSSSMRRRFNTNFPIFSFDLDILEMLTSWANLKSKDSKHSQKTMAPLLLGHLACSSLLLRYQNHHASSTETQVHQHCPIVSSQTNESAKFSGRCPVANSGNGQSGACLPHSSTVRESQQKESKSFYHHNSSPHKIPTTACNSSNFYPAFDQRESSVVSRSKIGCDRKLPSQDQVDCILKDWGNSSRANHHGNHKDAIPVEDSVPWSCRQCNNRHPHNHPYKDPESIRRQIQGSRVQFKPNFPTSVTSPLSGSSNLKYHNHHHYPLSHQRLRHSHLRQQQVNATENLQSDW